MNKNFKQVLAEIKAGRIPKTKTLYHVDYYLLNKTPYSFHFYAVYKNEKTGKDILTEVLYDLRNKKYFIKRNDREVSFNIANLDKVIPRTKFSPTNYRYYIEEGFYSKESALAFFEMVEVEENKGMYSSMLSLIGSIGDESTDMSSRALIRLITDYNKLELVYKAGIDLIVFQHPKMRELVVEAGVKGVTKVHEVFGLTKAQYKFLREFIGSDLLKFRSCILCGMSYLDQHDMDTYRGYVKHIRELEERYNIDERLETFNSYGGRLEAYISAIREHKTERFYPAGFFGFVYQFNIPNVPRMIEYLLFECLLSQGCEFRDALHYLRDYYRMCQDLEYERFEKYPKYLKTYHDIVTRNYKVVEDELTNKHFAEHAAKYKYLETTIKNYVIKVPEQSKDLVYEGNILQHCVGSYCKNVSEGKTMIVFLRDKKDPEEPLITMELRDNRILQVRGQANRTPTPEEMEAVRLFAKKFNFKVSVYHV